MASLDNRYSIFIRWAKLLLPLFALVLLSTVFLFGRKADPQAAIPYSDVDLEALASEPRISQPEYSGVTQSGDALSAKAVAATPNVDGDGGTRIEKLVAQLVGLDGTTTNISASTGRFSPAENRIELNEKVAIQTSDGYRMLSDFVEMTTDSGQVVSPGPVRGTGPMGTIDAGAMEIHRLGRGSAQNILFTQGVKLIYEPGSE
ncbi:hypothetical protein BFP70_10095 [Thioclava sp. SK-1]|uniref:LPS export ABC transporter periplasmic protein LptC n=1 Tax=Thioclava sp. SK-1 TaxID=1889770 RepID=UPI0008243E60|nr:LPS export ABC transporter periplasmic protein LptC [Thioclava sp. SK-1]OCX65400.1 hypothetical protein BFP70_10095 [Thioclava sp. SK-1]